MLGTAFDRGITRPRHAGGMVDDRRLLRATRAWWCPEHGDPCAARLAREICQTYQVASQCITAARQGQRPSSNDSAFRIRGGLTAARRAG